MLQEREFHSTLQSRILETRRIAQKREEVQCACTIHVQVESHPRQLIFLRKSDCLGYAVLLCLVVCLTLLASFFLPSHLSLTHVY